MKDNEKQPMYFIPRAMELSCDVDGCDSYLQMSCGMNDIQTECALRVPAVAEMMGWKIIDTKLYCPKCSQERRI